jgi:sugar-specific transcriptional regulator TrmB
VFTQDEVNLLKRLGLTTDQAKIYLALFRTEPSTAYQISKAANLSCEVAYRTLPFLQRIGLAEKTITIPTKYRATPLKSAINMLLENKDHENSELHSKAEYLLSTMVIEKRPTPVQRDSTIVMIPKGERLTHFVEEKLQTVKETFDLITTGHRFYGWTLTHDELFQQLLTKNITARFIVAGNGKAAQALKSLQQFQNLKIKFILDEIPACIGLYDNKEVTISYSANCAIEQAPIYWSDNPGILALGKTYFEKFWKAKQRKKEQTLIH